MSDWVGLGIILFLVACGLIGIWLLGRPYKVTQEEFDKRANEGGGLLGAGLMALQKLMNPPAEKAAIVLKDFKEGHLDGEQESGDDDDDEGSERSRGS